jgi:1,2-dihydroxy-3-keto-5-methylthiopentene dioxygenase
MSELTIYDAADDVRRLEQTSTPARMKRLLSEIGVSYDVWGVRDSVTPETDDAGILAAYAPEIARLKAEGGYVTEDVLRLKPGMADTAPLRAKFLSEHTHGEDEVRFFTAGAAAFYLRAENTVYRVVLNAGDLLSVPALTRHWFDMGPNPGFTTIRLFNNPEGWVAKYTGDPIAERVPYYEG